MTNKKEITEEEVQKYCDKRNLKILSQQRYKILLENSKKIKEIGIKLKKLKKLLEDQFKKPENK